MLQAPQVDQSFFHFTLQGMMIFGAIFGFGWKILKMLRKFDSGFNTFLWEHKVMWFDWTAKNKARMPRYPDVFFAPNDRRTHEEERHPTRRSYDHTEKNKP